MQNEMRARDCDLLSPRDPVGGIGLPVVHGAISSARDHCRYREIMEKSALAFFKYPNYRSKVSISRPVFVSFPEPLSLQRAGLLRDVTNLSASSLLHDSGFVIAHLHISPSLTINLTNRHLTDLPCSARAASRCLGVPRYADSGIRLT